MAVQAIWYVVLEQRAADVGNDFFATYAPVLLLSFINGALPLAIKRLTNYEEYKHPRTAAQVGAIARVSMCVSVSVRPLPHLFVCRPASLNGGDLTH